MNVAIELLLLKIKTNLPVVVLGLVALFILVSSIKDKKSKIKTKKPVSKRTPSSVVVDSKKGKTRAEIIGQYGEDKVSNVINEFSSKGVLINNILIKNNGYRTQIDHVFVANNRNLYVIETKNYSGIIRGDEDETYWTQFLGNKQYKMYNPIMQNNNHLKSLDELLKREGLRNYNLHNVVVFAGHNATIYVDCINDNVHELDGLRDIIKNLNVSNYNKRDAFDIVKAIKDNDLSSNEYEVKEHIKYVSSFKK